MPTKSSSKSPKSAGYKVGMFSAGEARCDRWQDLAHTAQALAARSASGGETGELVAKVKEVLGPLSDLEVFHAYPGETLMEAVNEAYERDDYSG